MPLTWGSKAWKKPDRSLTRLASTSGKRCMRKLRPSRRRDPHPLPRRQVPAPAKLTPGRSRLRENHGGRKAAADLPQFTFANRLNGAKPPEGRRWALAPQSLLDGNDPAPPNPETLPAAAADLIGISGPPPVATLNSWLSGKEPQQFCGRDMTELASCGTAC